MDTVREPAPALGSFAGGPRLATEDDLPWAIELGRRRNPDRWDAHAVEAWFRNIVLKQPFQFCYVRTEDAFLVGVINIIPWAPSEFEFAVALVYADVGCMWQALELLRYSIDWARKRRCTEWRINSESVHELGPLARRLGAREITPRYSLRLQ